MSCIVVCLKTIPAAGINNPRNIILIRRVLAALLSISFKVLYLIIKNRTGLFPCSP